VKDETFTFLLFARFFFKLKRVAIYLFLILQLAWLPCLAAEESVPFARVLAVEGLASLEPLHTNLVKDMPLPSGSRVTVMSNSKLLLRIGREHVLHLGPHSDLLLSRNLEELPSLRLAHGQFLLASGKKEPIEIRSGQIRVKLEADGVFIDHQKDQSALISLYSGKAKLRWRGKETILDSKGREQAIFLHPGKDAPEPAEKKRFDPPEDEFRRIQSWLNPAQSNQKAVEGAELAKQPAPVAVPEAKKKKE
jgi:hypothetical protein